MTVEPSEPFSGSVTPENSASQFGRMGTRRKPLDIGRVPNVVRNKESLESSMDPDQFRI